MKTEQLIEEAELKEFVFNIKMGFMSEEEAVKKLSKELSTIASKSAESENIDPGVINNAISQIKGGLLSLEKALSKGQNE
jgi:hypothetical protein